MEISEKQMTQFSFLENAHFQWPEFCLNKRDKIMTSQWQSRSELRTAS